MAKQNYDALKLENQLCFPLYAVSKEIVRRYSPFLDELDLTYTQYITLMVLWEKKTMNIKSLGECIYLDSGTLTPLLKKLQTKGYVSRVRDEHDERNVIVSITEKGEALKDKAISIPAKMGECLPLTVEEVKQLHSILYKILGNFDCEFKSNK